MKKNYNECVKDEKYMNENSARKTDQAYSYYSRVLKEPFDSVEELQLAEEAYYAKLRAKEEKAATKKADAKTVEDAFKNLNLARKSYKEQYTALQTAYREELAELKHAFENAKSDMNAKLADAEAKYSKALKEFTDKYPEGFHLTLKDGDFETTIDTRTAVSNRSSAVTDLFDLFFKF